MQRGEGGIRKKTTAEEVLNIIDGCINSYRAHLNSPARMDLIRVGKLFSGSLSGYVKRPADG